MTQKEIKKIRYSNVELLRIIAAFGIVWFHTGYGFGKDTAYSGLSVFLIIFISLIAYSHDNLSLDVFLRKRTSRLLLPWIFWSGVYGIMALMKIAIVDKPHIITFRLSYVLVGTSPHLWYLPYAFFVSILIYALIHTARNASLRPMLIISIIVSVSFLYGCSWLMQNYLMSVPWAQWVYGLSAIPIGFFVGYCLRFNASSGRRYMIVFSAVITAFCFFHETVFFKSLCFQYGIGTGLVCLAYLCPQSGYGWISFFSPFTFAVYLIHPIICSAASYICPAIRNSFILIAVAFLASMFAAWIIRKTTFRRFV